MRPMGRRLLAELRCRRIAVTALTGAIVTAAGGCFLAFGLHAEPPAEPQTFALIGRAVSLNEATAPASTSVGAPFSAQPAQHVGPHEGPSYLQNRGHGYGQAAPRASAASPRIKYASEFAHPPTIRVPLIIAQSPASNRPPSPRRLPAAEPLPALPGGPTLAPANGNLTATPSYRSVLGPTTGPADAISPYPGVHSQVNTPEYVVPREVYTGRQSSPAPQAIPREVATAPAASRAAPMIDQQANHHVRQAFSLAERGALYSARSELIQALRLVTQSLDAEAQSNEHSQALSAGLRALKESEDFMPRGTQLEADLNLAALVTSHRTPVLKSATTDRKQLASLTPMLAVQQYLTYAQRQLIVACDGTQAGSLSLYGLGRLHMAMAELSAEAPRRRHPQAMTLYQAAVASDPKNFLAANELGVMLARYGRHEAAKQILVLAVQETPRAETWHNLSMVHQKLGEAELANLARQEFVTAKTQQQGKLRFASNNGLTPPTVEWMSPESFARQQAGPVPPVAVPRQATRPEAASIKKEKPSGVTSWLKPWQTKQR